MFHLRWFKPPTPKPFYYSQMNPEERVIWEIIGKEKITSYFTKHGKIKTRKLSKEERAHSQKIFFDNRCGRGIFGGDWMRSELPKSKNRLGKEGQVSSSDTSASDGSEVAGRSAGEWPRE
ncbi:hypothetical protein OPT61_g5073 [Boeremia exigua]|uniref:Uncharacterized protein n=1 Tax=Boeremia exigua TaxID=749465 RepID=A0ACC2IBT2_9PLEO|nr:hypothetical protein OPT61_g5073 [Boeremia exigua]